MSLLLAIHYTIVLGILGHSLTCDVVEFFLRMFLPDLPLVVGSFPERAIVALLGGRCQLHDGNGCDEVEGLVLCPVSALQREE